MEVEAMAQQTVALKPVDPGNNQSKEEIRT